MSHKYDVDFEGTVGECANVQMSKWANEGKGERYLAAVPLRTMELN
jgi:hypothetical protein